MTSLFNDLFKYRGREKREAMEDWLTECLAAILRALSPEAFAAVIQDLTGQDCKQLLGDGARIAVATQVTISQEQTSKQRIVASEKERTQRPDMIISLDEQPWLLFECKVAHSVDESRSTDPRFASQLQRYGRWLQKSKFSAPAMQRALIFLTHHTLPPVDFTMQSSAELGYQSLSRHVATWGSIARSLNRATASLSPEYHARALVDAYVEFLEDNSLSDEYPNSQDVALLGVHLPAVDRLDKLVADMFSRINGIGTSWNGNAYFETEIDIGRYQKVRWVHLPKGWPTDAYVQTGIWFPDSPTQTDRQVMDSELGDAGPITSAPKVFLQLAHEKDSMFPHANEYPGDDWLRPVSNFFVFHDFDEFYGDPAARAVSIFAWLDEKVGELKEFIHE